MMGSAWRSQRRRSGRRGEKTIADARFFNALFPRPFSLWAPNSNPLLRRDPCKESHSRRSKDERPGKLARCSSLSEEKAVKNIGAAISLAHLPESSLSLLFSSPSPSTPTSLFQNVIFRESAPTSSTSPARPARPWPATPQATSRSSARRRRRKRRSKKATRAPLRRRRPRDSKGLRSRKGR